MTPPLAAVWREGRVLACRPEGSAYFSLAVEAGGEPSSPGQFYLVGVGPEAPFPNDPLLLRPMSVLSDESGRLRFLFKPVGRGTRALAAMQAGDRLRLLGPLGRPFTEQAFPPPLLIGGGAGVPPLHFLSRRLSRAGIEHRFVLGFNSAPEIPRGLLEELAVTPELCTLDGSAGFGGNPVEYLAREPQRPPARIQACGPPALLNALRAGQRAEDELELSLEEHMACGVGVCRGCVVALRDGEDWRYGTVCRDGPVFDVRELMAEAGSALSDMAPESCDCETGEAPISPPVSGRPDGDRGGSPR